ncbi:uncharacterized protein C1orf21 homolog isoform X2 [Cynocephalus volans]|uniref:uncharacterized protein C1orf21 homolog isoform X2 n=1 Tax=Cynocephalus volans TaxID=110931 RepID=UPI002FC985A0
MGCASAKHVATVQNEEEAQKGKSYQNGDAFGDEYRIKPVEEVKYMKNGAEEEQKIAVRNQENLRAENHQCYCRNPQRQGKTTPSMSLQCNENRRSGMIHRRNTLSSCP